MVNYAVFGLTIFIGTALCAPSPSESKRYRNDYQYNERTDAFYKLHIESRSGRRVKSVCEVEGASLMVPATHEDIIQVHGMFKRYPDLGKYLWIAFDGHEHESAEEPARITFEEPQYLERDSFRYPFERFNSHPWRSDYDDDDGLFMRPGSPTQCDVLTRSGDIAELPCYRELPFVCKVEAKDAPYDPHCDVFANNYQYNASVGSCYRIPPRIASWNEAYSECRKEGAHLVVLNSDAERAVVQKLMQTTPSVEGAHTSWFFHAGFRADDKTLTFRTVFNETLSEAGFTKWSPGEPNNDSGHEFCGTLFKNDGLLNDVYCDHEYAYICEKEVTVQP